MDFKDIMLGERSKTNIEEYILHDFIYKMFSDGKN